MKKAFSILIACMVLNTLPALAQNSTVYKAGNLFYVSLPDYLHKTRGLNSSATIQYKNVVKEVYGFIIEDTKEDLAMDEIQFSSMNEFFQDFINGFVKDKEKLKGLKPRYEKRGDISFAECELMLEATESMPSIYYLIGVVETKSCYYKVLSWTKSENKDRFSEDFQKILYSVKD